MPKIKILDKLAETEWSHSWARLLRTASFRLTALYSLVLMFSFALLLFFTYLTLTSTIREQIKNEVREDSETLLADIRTGGLNFAVSQIRERVRLSMGQGAYYFLADAKGQKIAGNLERISSFNGWRETDFQGLHPAEYKYSEDDDHKLWGQGVTLDDGSFLFVGQDAIRAIAAQEAIIDTFLWSAGIALLLATSLGALISQGFLRRIDAINRTSEAIISGTLKARIPIRGTSDEIDQLSANLNKLFDSNQKLLESLRQVTVSIAHDLRTPLSRLRQGLEEARSGPQDFTLYTNALDNAIADSEGLLSTFAALLRIAQIESGSRKSGFRMIDLSALLDRLISAYTPVVEDQEKIISAVVEPGIEFLGDGELLLQAAANLLENAIHHTTANAHIEVRLTRMAGNGISMTVADTGPGIPADMRAKVFERFFRLDRSRSTPGNGLGLPLVAAVAELHGITIHMEDNQPGLIVRLCFPKAE